MGNDQSIRVASTLLPLPLGLAMPLGPAAAGVPNDTSASTNSRQALPSESAKTGGMIVVADKYKNKNWHNDKYYYNKNWTIRMLSWCGPTANGTSSPFTAL